MFQLTLRKGRVLGLARSTSARSMASSRQKSAARPGRDDEPGQAGVLTSYDDAAMRPRLRRVIEQPASATSVIAATPAPMPASAQSKREADGALEATIRAV